MIKWSHFEFCKLWVHQEKNEFVKLEMFRHNFDECLRQKPRKKWIFLRFFYAYISSNS